MTEQIPGADFRVATAADADALADAHRDSIRSLNATYYPEQIVEAWIAVVQPRVNSFVETGRGDVASPSGLRMPCVFMRKDIRT